MYKLKFYVIFIHFNALIEILHTNKSTSNVGSACGRNACGVIGIYIYKVCVCVFECVSAGNGRAARVRC